MESNFESGLQFDSKVILLKDQRKLRRQRDAESAAEGEVESIEELRCEGGVCSLSWSPKGNVEAA